MVPIQKKNVVAEAGVPNNEDSSEAFGHALARARTRRSSTPRTDCRHNGRPEYMSCLSSTVCVCLLKKKSVKKRVAEEIMKNKRIDIPVTRACIRS